MKVINVIAKNKTKVKRTVYAVRDNPKTGEVEFLIYGNAEWLWMPARYYKPKEQPSGK